MEIKNLSLKELTVLYKQLKGDRYLEVRKSILLEMWSRVEPIEIKEVVSNGKTRCKSN